MITLRMKVSYLFRKKEPLFHSIESVFVMIIPLVGIHFKTERLELHYDYATPKGIRKNLRQLQSDCPNRLFHITGHVNYMALRTGRMSVLTIHDIRSALKGNFLARFIKLIFWFWFPALIVKRITVISEFSRKELRKLVPFTARKTVVVPNPVHPDFIFNTRDEIGPIIKILLVGTKPNKNLERTLEALKGLQVTLTIVGNLSETQQSLLNEIGLEYVNHIDLPHQSLIRIYREADLLCFPSTYEGFGMPIIEAQATGRPVVTSDLGAMKGVAGEGACLVDPYDVSSIRKGVLKVIEDEAYRNLLVERGLENVKRFKAESVAEQYIEVYKEVFGNNMKEVNE